MQTRPLNEEKNLSLNRRPKSRSLQTLQRWKDLETQRIESVNAVQYERAQELREEYLRSIKLEDERLIKEEKERQAREKEFLKTAIQKLGERYKKSWMEKMQQFSEMCDQKEKHLQDKHENELQEFWKRVNDEKAKFRYRYSSRVRELREQEEQLLKNHLYLESKEVRRRRLLLQEAEERQMNNKFQENIQRRLERLLDKQDKERKFLLGHIRNMKQKKNLERKRDIKRVRQMFKNLSQDMQHAHTMEFIQLREVEKTIGISRRSHRDTSATYRGTQLYKRLSDPYKLPSLCKIYAD